MGKIIQIIVKTYYFVGLTGSVCERKRYQTNINNENKFTSNIDKKQRCGNDAPKSDANLMENCANMESKR